MWEEGGGRGGGERAALGNAQVPVLVPHHWFVARPVGLPAGSAGAEPGTIFVRKYPIQPLLLRLPARNSEMRAQNETTGGGWWMEA